MDDRETVVMMQRCIEEIKELRRMNAELAPKADAYDALRQVLNMIPGPSHVPRTDSVHLLEVAISNLPPIVAATPNTNKG